MTSPERDIRRAFERAAGGRRPRPDRKFNRDEEYVAYGLKVPELERVWRDFRPRFKALSSAERFELGGRLLRTHIGELGHTGIHLLALGTQELRPTHVRRLDAMLDDFRGWSHVDHFCGAVMQPLLVRHEKDVLALVARWNQSANRWKRRASVVTFTRKIGESGAYTDEVLRLCDRLIWDPEDLVQKGVGWALKDNLRSAPERILPYVKRLREQGVPSTITLYAIRDLRGAKRREVLAVKKAPPSHR